MKRALSILIGSLIFGFISTITFAADIFNPPIEYSIPELSTIEKIDTGDFNNDGHKDVVGIGVSGGGWGYVFSLLGNGKGAFQTIVDYGSGQQVGGDVQNCTVGDFNGDAKMDMVTINSVGTVFVYPGNGDGTFQNRIDYNTGLNTSPSSITTGDFNGDGKLDVAATKGYLANSIFVLIGDGNGSFSARFDYDTGWFPRDIVAGDFNNDGKLDLATANGFDTISILIGNGDGTFQPNIDYNARAQVIWCTTSKPMYCSYNDAKNPLSIATGDFNNDGKMDLAIGNERYSGSYFIFLGIGDGTFQAGMAHGTFSYGTDTALRWMATGDFNGDGRLDLAAIISYYWDGIIVMTGNGDGTFQTGYYPNNYRLLVADDFNNDGKTDMAAAVGNTVSILLNIYNRLPIASASPDLAIECAGPSGASVTLDGSASSDPDGDPLTYTWTWDGGSAEGVNPTVTLPLGTTVVTLTVGDGKATATDTVNITVQDTTSPVTTATGGSDNWYNANVIAIFSATDSCSGVKEIHYTVNGAETVIPGDSSSLTLTADGIYSVAYYSIDNAGNAESPKSMTVKIDKTPPVLNLSTNPNILWPPNHKMVDVLIGGNATDSTSGVASVLFNVKDEYGIVQPSISDFNMTIQLEVWREGTDNDGRYYTITAVATDAAGNKSTASTVVLVPHDQGN